MATYYRRDDWVFNNFIQAIANANVTYYTQPSLAPATVYNDANGDIVANPQITDGFGHAVAYLAAGIYTITYSGQQIITLTLPDQQVGAAGGGGSVTVFSGTPTGTIDGTNRVFTIVNVSTPLTALPTQITAWLNFPLIQGTGYTLAVVAGQLQITYAVAPQTGDTLYAQGIV